MKHKTIIIILCFCAIVSYAQKERTASKFLSFGAGVSTSFITGSSASLQTLVANEYKKELDGLGMNMSFSTLPKTSYTLGALYGVPFNDKIMMFTGFAYVPRGFEQRFILSKDGSLMQESTMKVTTDYWDFYFGLRHKSKKGRTVGIGVIKLFNVVDKVNIQNITYTNGVSLSTSKEMLLHDYYGTMRKIFPIAPFVNIGYQSKWWQVELEANFTNNIFLNTLIDLSYFTLQLKGHLVIAWQ